MVVPQVQKKWFFLVTKTQWNLQLCCRWTERLNWLKYITYMYQSTTSSPPHPPHGYSCYARQVLASTSFIPFQRRFVGLWWGNIRDMWIERAATCICEAGKYEHRGHPKQGEGFYCPVLRVLRWRPKQHTQEPKECNEIFLIKPFCPFRLFCFTALSDWMPKTCLKMLTIRLPASKQQEGCGFNSSNSGISTSNWWVLPTSAGVLSHKLTANCWPVWLAACLSVLSPAMHQRLARK